MASGRRLQLASRPKEGNCLHVATIVAPRSPFSSHHARNHARTPKEIAYTVCYMQQWKRANGKYAEVRRLLNDMRRTLHSKTVQFRRQRRWETGGQNGTSKAVCWGLKMSSSDGGDSGGVPINP